jgi:transitional endoplasmic reticulum ATPase
VFNQREEARVKTQDLAEQTALSPGQTQALARLVETKDVAPLIMFKGPYGSGRTTVAARLAESAGGVLLTSQDCLRSFEASAHHCFEERWLKLVEEALYVHELVVLDDFEYWIGFGATRRNATYGRGGVFLAAWQALADTAWRLNKPLITIWPDIAGADQRSLEVSIPPMSVSEYAFFASVFDNDAKAALDVAGLFELAPNLSIYQLKRICALAAREGRGDAAAIAEILHRWILRANTKRHEVADVSFKDLVGFENIVDALTTYVINPMKGDRRLRDLKLTPKRGVLLHGPPGTGKTSIGRALAREMEGKFFLIDGSIPPEPPMSFYNRLGTVLYTARLSAPSVVFIDDADLLFQSENGAGLNRLLLTYLDGLASENVSKVTVILTASDLRCLPQPLLRSGRIELWLETTLPDEKSRIDIVSGLVRNLPSHFASYDPAHVSRLTQGFNAADLKRLVADVKALYARDIVGGRDVRVTGDYFEAAVGEIQRSRMVFERAASIVGG